MLRFTNNPGNRLALAKRSRVFIIIIAYYCKAGLYTSCVVLVRTDGT